jgi:hypothetical protein
MLGKLVGQGKRDKFTLYDAGQDPSKLSHYNMAAIRSEHGAFCYRYEPCNVGNIRKMLISIPAVHPVNLSKKSQVKYESMLDAPQAIY